MLREIKQLYVSNQLRIYLVCLPERFFSVDGFSASAQILHIFLISEILVERSYDVIITHVVDLM